MNIHETAARYEDYIIEQRRWFHSNPELSLQEFNTAAHIRGELDKMGISWKAVGNGTSTLAEIRGSRPGRTFMLRSDIDALPVTEDTGLPYSSSNPGVMHACGHDCHAAILLTAAHILCDMKDELAGTVRLLFEASEENGLGAKIILDKDPDILDGVEGIFAAHVWSELESGKISVEPGPRMAAGHRFEIFVHGKGCHGARPHLGIDAGIAASAIALNLQTLVSRNFDPQEMSLITIGQIHAGNQYNVVPAEAYMEGTPRTFSREIDKMLPQAMERVVRNTAAAYGAEAELVYHYLLAPTINDEALTEQILSSLKKIGGEDIVGHMKATTTSETFSCYQERIPGVLAFIGVANEACDSCWPQHSEHYKVDESVLLAGAKLYAQAAMDFNAK